MKNIFSKKRIIGLSPMARYTDSSFRQLCKEYGADLVYTELISAKGLIYDREKKGKMRSWDLAKFTEFEQPILVQLFGDEPDVMAKAAQLIMTELKPFGIDINMGCPASKVVKNNSGSYLMTNPELAFKIVRKVRAAIGDGFLSVKTRLGWDEKIAIYEFAKGLEKAGVDMIALHCRTKQEKFHSVPEWEAVARVKNEVKIPVLANGGINNIEDASECFKVSKADGVLIGRASIGRPWIFEEIKTGKVINKNFDEVTGLVRRHIKLYEKTNSKFDELRKHLSQYYKGINNATKLRSALVQCNNMKEFEEIIEDFKKNEI